MADTATYADPHDAPAARRRAEKRDVGVRRCIVTRAKRPQEQLLRYVVDPDGVVVADVAGRLPGRGVWVTPDRAILAKAIGGGRFKAGFRADVTTPDNLLAETERLLDRRLVELVGLARGAGHIAAGWEQAREFARKHAIGLALVAADAAPGARRKLLGLASGAPVMDMLDAATLGRAMGRERVVNALVMRGKFADMLALEAARRRGLLDCVQDGAAATTPDGEGSDR